MNFPTEAERKRGDAFILVFHTGSLCLYIVVTWGNASFFATPRIIRKEGLPKGTGVDRVMYDRRKITKTEEAVSDLLVVVVSFLGTVGTETDC